MEGSTRGISHGQREIEGQRSDGRRRVEWSFKTLKSEASSEPRDAGACRPRASKRVWVTTVNTYRSRRELGTPARRRRRPSRPCHAHRRRSSPRADEWIGCGSRFWLWVDSETAF